MIGRKFDNFDAMIFNRCNSIHTMLMSINIDVLFIDSENKICDLRKELKPWKPFIRAGDAISVIELPEGTIKKTGTEIGDTVNLNAEVTQEKERELNQNFLVPPEAMTFLKTEINSNSLKKTMES